MDVDRLKKLTGAVRTGGKGTVRRKKKAVHKPAATDDKRLQNTLKRLGVNVIPGIEEVMIMKEEGSVIHFTNPKAVDTLVEHCTMQFKHRSVQTPTWSVDSHKRGLIIATHLFEGTDQMFPGLWQGGPGGPSPESLERLKGMMSAAGGMPGIPEGRTEEDDDEDVPDLVEGQFGDD